jgi:peptidyl-prolyl cis-trans isomerase D
MIQLFRSKLAKQITVVFFAFLMVAFLLTGVDYSGLGAANSVGSINGRSVDVRSFDALVQQQTQAAAQQAAGPLSLEDVSAIRNQVWEQLVQQRVLEDEYRRYGLSATEEEIAELLRTNPPRELFQAPDFQTDSQFDLAKYQRWLTSPSATPYVDALGAQMREQVLRSKLLTLVAADVYLSDAALWEKFRDANEMVKVALTAIIPRNLFADSALAVTPAEVEEYFRNHADEFKRGRVAYLSSIAIPRLVTASDSAAALARAQAARAEIVAGAPFAEVAERESSDPVSGPRGGDLGTWARGAFDPAFDSAAFELPLHTLSQPVLSSFGYHLIEVSNRTADSATGRHILFPVEVSGENRDRLDARADTLDRFAAAQSDPSALDSVAAMLRVPVRRAAPVQEGSRVQIGTQVVPDAGVWAFEAQQGEISQVIESPDAYYQFRLDSLKDQSTPVLADVRPAVEQAVRAVKRREAARGIAENYLTRVREGSAPAQAAAALKLAHTEFGPFNRISPPLDTPELVGASFGLEVGEQSGVLDTEQGLYVVRVLEHTPADSAAFVAQLDQFRLGAVREARQVRVRNFLASLRETAKVVDNRAEVYQRARANQADQAL